MAEFSWGMENMAELIEPVETSVGVVCGRDGFYLDEIDFNYNRGAVRFTGEINGNLCSRNINVEWIEYSLVFFGVLWLNMTNTDFVTKESFFTSENGRSVGRQEWDEAISPIQKRSSFAVVIDSSWLAYLSQLDSADKITSEHRHYIFRTYDYTFELISSKYELTI